MIEISNKNTVAIVLGLLAMLVGCRPAPSEAPVEDYAGVLRTVRGSLYILNPPPGAKRGHVFLVASQYTIGDGQDRMRVGLVEGVRTHGKSLHVTELCPVPEQERGVLTSVGLPVIALREDTQPRVRNCLARYMLEAGAWEQPGPLVDLRLDVGLGDGVRPGDRYEVQGAPVADSINKTVTGFEPLGQCVVLRSITEGLAWCRLDRKQWHKFDRDHALSGGFAILRRSGE